MPKFVMIRGPSGIGKSTVAKEVAKALGPGTILLETDKLQHEMMIDFDKIPIAQRLYFVYESSKHIIDVALKTGHNVVADGWFCYDDLELLNEVLTNAKTHASKVTVFELNAELETVMKRAKRRSRKEDEDSNYELVVKRFHEFRKFIYQDAVRIETQKKSAKSVAKEILKSCY